MLRSLAGVLLCAIIVAHSPVTPRAASPDSAPPLPPPAGQILHVATEAALQSAIAAAPSGATIVIAPGTYVLSSTLYLNRAVSDLTIRGATDNRNDVVLAGPGMANAGFGAVPHGIWTGGGVVRLTVANLTIRDVYHHPLIFNAGTEQPRVYNVRLLDAGEQFLKANPDGSGGGVDGGVVEYSVIEYSSQARSPYTNGVDVHGGQDWVIRHNLFRRIRAAGGLAGPAVLMWNHSQRTIVDGNTFVDCHREISLGLIARTPDDHVGGVVRNNMIVRAPGAGGDVGIAVFDSPGTRVVHNSVWLSGAYSNAIEYRFADTAGVSVVNNLADRPALSRDGATATLAGNVWTATADLFVNVSAADLHLAAGASAAIDHGVAAPDTTTDWDRQARPNGGAPDVGADEQEATGAPGAPVETCGDGIDNDGDGLIDEGCAPGPLSAPGRPMRLVGRVDGATVGLRWDPPITGGAATGYVVEAGLSPGATLLTVPLGPAPAVAFPGVGAGTYFVRVRAANAAGAGPVSDEIAVSPGCPRPPAPPTGLSASVAGAALAVSWRDATGCAGTRYRLLVGSVPGGSNLATLAVGAPMFAATAPPGRYYLRVVTDWSGGTTAPSNEVTVDVGSGCPPPAVPVTLSGSELARRLDLRWTPSSAAAAEAVDAVTPIGYRLEAGRSAGATDVGILPIGRVTGLAAAVGPGTYHVRVRAVSACGAGTASNEVTLVVL